MNDTNTKESSDGVANDSAEKPETMEVKIRRRIGAAIQGEVDRLNKYAAIAKDQRGDGAFKQYCHAIESIASVKGRAEMYCIQVEMAMQTAAMASVMGGVMGGAANNKGPRSMPTAQSALEDLVRRGSSPGQETPKKD